MAEKTKVTRIKATDTKKATSKAEKVAKPGKVTKNKVAKVKKVRKPRLGKIGKFFAPITGYFKGAWLELKQVRWPNRRSTWGLTLAVILFSAFFIVLIVLLDTFFKYIFELIIT